MTDEQAPDGQTAPEAPPPSGPPAAEPTAAEPTAAEPTAAEPTAAEPTAAEPTAAEAVAPPSPAAAEADAPPSPAAAQAPPAAGPQGAVGPETVERFGHPLRHFAVAISSEAMALAWANQEQAPQGATVVVDHEINPRGLHGRLWDTPQPDTLAASVVLRPPVSVEEADVAWLVAGLAGVRAAEELTGMTLATWWPDEIVEAESRDPIGLIRAEVQLGPGQVKAAVITVRLNLDRLELDPEATGERLLEALLSAVDKICEGLADGGAAATASAYAERCGMIGKRVKVRLRPKGETRGVARDVDKAGRLEVQSMSGMIERIGVNQLMDLDVV